MDNQMIHPAVVCAGHSSGDTDVAMVLGMHYDVINQVLVF